MLRVAVAVFGIVLTSIAFGQGFNAPPPTYPTLGVPPLPAVPPPPPSVGYFPPSPIPTISGPNLGVTALPPIAPPPPSINLPEIPRPVAPSASTGSRGPNVVNTREALPMSNKSGEKANPPESRTQKSIGDARHARDVPVPIKSTYCKAGSKAAEGLCIAAAAKAGGVKGALASSFLCSPAEGALYKHCMSTTGKTEVQSSAPSNGFQGLSDASRTGQSGFGGLIRPK